MAYTKEQKERILEIYSTTHKTDDAIKTIKEELGIDFKKNSLIAFASKNNVKKKVTAFTSQSKIEFEEVIQLVKDYESGDFTVKELMEKYGYKTRKSITDKVKNYNGKMRTIREAQRLRCSYDENIFENIDEDWKAYFLGLLLTDGYVSSTRNTVGLDLIDEEVIKFLSEKSNKDYVLAKHGGKNKGHDRYRITFTSRKMADDLVRFGIIPNKSLKLKAPEFHEDELKFIPYLIKGIIDGDGWVRKDGKEFFVGTSSLDFMEWLKELLESFGMIDIKINTKTFEKDEWNDFYIIRTANQHNIKVLKEILKNCNIGMSYKYNNLFQEGRSETITRESQ